MPCDACAAIVINRRNAPGHDGLVPTGVNHDYKPVGQAVVNVSEHRCKDCDTVWRYENDKNDDFAGWSLAG